jgi:hypothetical protein
MRPSDSRAHRAPALLLVVVLCLATGLAFLGLGAALGTPRMGPGSPADSATEAAVDHFYEAVNRVLATGDPARLDEVVAPGFVDHDPAPGMPPDRDGLTALLVARHATFPGARLVVDHVVTSGDEAAVRVHAEGVATGEFLGLPLPASAGSWGPIEALRIAGDRVVERWGTAPSPLVGLPLWQTSWPGIEATTRAAVFLERRVYAAGGGGALGGDAATRLVSVEAGALVATAEAAGERGGAAPLPRLLARGDRDPAGTGAASATLQGPAELTAGDLVAVPPTGRLTVRNDGAAAAVAIVVAVAPPDRLPAGSATAARSSAEVSLRADGEVAGGRLVLAPGGTYDLPRAAGTVLAVVEAGALEPAPGQTVTAGNGVTVAVGDGDRWRSAGTDPAVLVVVTFPPSRTRDATATA